ncbi:MULTISPECIES: hypothetical protein [Haloferax]|uniref:Uncharacterized protein n=1 Tax=Haloferax marinum TaxID=2666143 RepID=A0A6A8G5W0_9EURY|nr:MULTISPECIES: hypothetical protein [Haloferax]KAB1197499.1 hypothetical protein Hfx1150_08205 [Haloferax sp. CBA1150]MRW96544.1 hypothetical protein [Haloferax marinum]
MRALSDRVGFVTAVIAFAAGALGPLEQILYGDVLRLVAGPALTGYYGFRWSGVADRSVQRLTVRVVGGALVGATLGTLVGWAVSRGAVFGGTRGLAQLFTPQATVSVLTEPLLMPPVAIATAVGVIGGLVVRVCVGDSSRTDSGPSADSSRTDGGPGADSWDCSETGSWRRLVAVGWLCGFLGAFAVVMHQFGWLFASRLPILGGVHYGFLAAVATPLVAVGAAALVASPPVTHYHVEWLVSSTAMGTALGSVFTYTYALVSEERLVSALLPSIVWRLVVDLAAVFVVVTLAALAGSAYAPVNSQSAGRDTQSVGRDTPE